MSAHRADERRSHRSVAPGRVHVRRAALPGFAGDTLASALLANGVRVFGRSFKYHRPRGLLAAGSEEPNALVIGRRDAGRRTPNLRATQVEIYEGLVAESQNRWPALGFDVQAVNDVLAPLLPAAFYYKTFMWPRSAWHRWYEPAIRRAAGLGRAPSAPDPDRYAQRFAHCDVLVVGAGPAGLAAALAAAATGARVMLCDEQPEPGGSLLDEQAATIDGQPLQQWLASAIAALCAQPNVTLLTRTTAFGYFPHNLIGLCERLTDHRPAPAAGTPRERLWQVRAREVVLATGAIERPLVFPGNDRPGVMLASAASTYLHRYGVSVGSRIVLVTGCDAAYATALDLHAAGATIALIADVREAADGAGPAAARAAGLEVVDRATVLGTSGRLGIRSVTLGTIADATIAGQCRTSRLRCAADVRRPHPERAPVLAVARQAGLGCRAHGVPAGAIRRTGALGGRVPRHRRPRDRAQRRRPGRPGRGPCRRSQRRAAADACCVT